ncbi:MAG TPA: copper homeostasis membrane protein CopD [Bradyrhizobium sp.]|nr:copper homeostasis membrane protein CopD [Bradyrhizobium sp.]
MNWLGAGVDGPLVVVRGVHFAATAVMTGTLIFREVVAEAASCSARPAALIVRTQTLRVAWIFLAVAAASGMIWLLLVAASMSGLSFGESMTSDVLSTVVNETQFGRVSEIRLVLAVIIAGGLAYDRFPLARGLALAMSLGLTAALAWTGHAGSTAGAMGILHLTADTLHLLAAAIWIGGIVSLVLLLSVSRNDQTDAGVSFARDATQRFSTMGVAIVVVVLATGIVNGWILVGSWHALIATFYGQLLILKIALFAVMLLIAAANRFWLMPRLALRPGSEPQIEVLRRLARNSMIEIVLALMIFAIVGMLGTLHPAIHGL